MLSAGHRVRRRADFSRVIKEGRRAGTRSFVIHAQSEGDHPPRLGLVVSKAVGGSVERHRVARRLRGVVAEQLSELPAGLTIILRALPASASASAAELRADFESGLRRVMK